MTLMALCCYVSESIVWLATYAKVEKGRNGRVHTLSYLGLHLAQDFGHQGYLVGTYVHTYTLYRREKYVFGESI